MLAAGRAGKRKGTCSFSTARARMVGRTGLLSQPSNGQYPRRCGVSRPGSGWDGVGPPRCSHATGSGASIAARHSPSSRAHTPPHAFPQGSPRPCARVASTPRRASSARRFPGLLPGDLPTSRGEGTHLGAQFPLRCFQRFLLPDIATEPAGRPTTPPPAVRPRRSSRTKRSPPQSPKRPERIETELSHDVLNPARVPL